MEQRQELLTVEHLTKSYDGKGKALHDMSLSLRRGEFVTVIGPSGAGKSTFLRCVNRLIDASEGSIVFDGREITSMNKRQMRKVRRDIGMIFQHYNLVHRATAIENVLQGRLGYLSDFRGIFGLYSEEDKRSAFELLDKMGLAEFAYQRADQLSGGQQQRVGIARARSAGGALEAAAGAAGRGTGAERQGAAAVDAAELDRAAVAAVIEEAKAVTRANAEMAGEAKPVARAHAGKPQLRTDDAPHVEVGA